MKCLVCNHEMEVIETGVGAVVKCSNSACRNSPEFKRHAEQGISPDEQARIISQFRVYLRAILFDDILTPEAVEDIVRENIRDLEKQRQRR